MTWPEAIDYACPASWGTGALGGMVEKARAALEGAEALFSYATEGSVPEVASPRAGIALACMAAGLDAQARSLALGSSGGQDLLIGDGLVTRALEIASEEEGPTLDLLVELATEAMGSAPPSATMLAMLQEIARRRAASELLVPPLALIDPTHGGLE